jgi:DNA-binding beta-propeller fold protein YncE
MRANSRFVARFVCGLGIAALIHECSSERASYAQETRGGRGVARTDGCKISDGHSSKESKNRLTLVAGGGTGGDGSTATQAKLVAPFGVAFDSKGVLFFVEMTGHRLRKIGHDGRLATIAGSGREGSGGDAGPAAQAELNGPHSLAVAKNDAVFVADTWNNRVRKIDPQTGVITTVAGTGRKGFSGDGGPAVEAEFGGIYCLALDQANQTLCLADLDNRRVRQIDLKTGIVSTLAGNGKKGVPVDGDDARTSPLVDPRAVALDGQGSVYILERSGHALRVVDRTGKIRTLAGTGQAGDSGDGGDARQARMNGPKHLCVSPDGDVLIADTENHRVRVFNPTTGIIDTLAGTGRKGASGLGGSAKEAELSQPHGVTIGPGGFVYISDSSNDRILKMEPSSK